MTFFTDTEGGLRVIGRQGGGEPMIRTYIVAATDATVLARGDLVKTIVSSTPLGADAVSGLAICTKAAAGDIPRGVVVDIAPNFTSLFLDPALVRPASVRYAVRVCDDPLALLAVTSSGTPTIGDTDIGAKADIKTTTPNTTTGASATFLDSSTLTTESGSGTTLLVNRLVSGLTIDATRVEVTFAKHELAVARS